MTTHRTRSVDDSPLLDARAHVNELEHLEPCSGCGGHLALAVLSFARCVGCGAQNYRRPPWSEPADVVVTRFWSRIGPMDRSRERSVGSVRRKRVQGGFRSASLSIR